MKFTPSRAMPFAAIAASLALGACGTGDANDSSTSTPATGTPTTAVKGGPGVDVAAKTIRIGDITALTGPAAALGKPVAAGHRAFFKELNAKGGINGWKIRLTVKDSGYSPQQHVQLFNGVKGDIALLNSFGSPTTKAIQPQLDREKLVTFPASFDSVWGDDPVIAPVGTPYAYDVANALDFVTAGGAKNPKVGIISQNDEYGEDGLRGYEAAKDVLGFDDVGRATYKPGDTDFTAQVQKLKSAGANVVVLTTLPSATGPIVGTAATLGFKPQWILQGPAFLEQLITADGTLNAKPTPIAPALQGAIVTSFSAPWSSSVPGMKDVVAAHDEYSPDTPPSIYFASAYAQAKVQTAVLAKAIASGDLSREGILKAKTTLGLVDLGGIAPNPNFTPEGGPPSTASLITTIDPRVDGFLKEMEADHKSAAADALGG